MIAALRYEWVRLTTLRSTYWLIGLAVGLHVLVATLIAWGMSASDVSVDSDTAFSVLATSGASTGGPPLLVAYLLGVMAVFAFGHEYRHGMIRATLTAVASRPAIFAAKGLVVGVVVATVAALTVMLTIPIQAAFDLGSPDELGSMLVGVVLFCVLFAWSGLAFTALFRHQTAGMLLLLLVPTVVEYVLRYVVIIIKAFSDEPTQGGGLAVVLKYLPYDAGGQMYTRQSLDLAEFLGFTPFGAVGGGIVMGVFVTGLLVLAFIRFVRSDA